MCIASIASLDAPSNQRIMPYNPTNFISTFSPPLSLIPHLLLFRNLSLTSATVPREQVAPPEEHYPKEDEEMAAVVIDRSGDFLTVACGPNVAFTTKKSFLTAGDFCDFVYFWLHLKGWSCYRFVIRESLISKFRIFFI